jgi:hypothetical protein
MRAAVAWLGVVGITLLVALAPGGSGPEAVAASSDSPPAACRLTRPQKAAAVGAWEAMMPVFRHPRCTNCHGGVDPAVPFGQGGHRGAAVTDTATCKDCHSLLEGWRVPQPVLHFTTKNNRELCIFIKRLMPRHPVEFVEHIEFEPRNPHFIKQAFVGDKALNNLGEITLMDDFGIQARRDPPPGSHAGLVQMATNWGTKVGRAWSDSPECGCEIDGAWVGTVKAKGTFLGFNGAEKIEVTSRADVVLDLPERSRAGSGNSVKNYESIFGTVTWDLLVSGNCRGNAGGSLQLNTRDVDGNPMAELRTEELGPQKLSYQPTTGSQPELWSPIFDVQCTISGTKLTLPMTNPLPTWWHYDVPNYMISTDPKRLKGSYRWVPGPGSLVIWEWDLERQ